MATLAYIDETGIHIPSYPEVLEDLQAAFRTIYGDDVYLESDSQEGQLLAVFALRIHDCNTLAAAVYNSFSPATAQGTGLSRMVKVNGLRRTSAGYSSVDLLLVGQVGTVISAGVATDNAEQRWVLPETVTIPEGGEVTVTAVAEQAGDIRAAAGEISTIATPTRGWHSVTNPGAAVPGAPVESDAVLRQRQAVSTALPSLSVFEGCKGAVAAIAAVTRWQGYENDTDVPDANGLPAHSICMVVEGGDSSAIAAAIAAKKTPGTKTHGDVQLVVRDSYGSPSTICFFRPTVVQVAVAITIRPLSGYLAATGEAIRAGVVAYLNALQIGEDLLLSKLYTPVNAAEPTTGRRTFDVVSLEVGVVGPALAAANLPVAFNAVVSCLLDDVVLTVEP